MAQINCTVLNSGRIPGRGVARSIIRAGGHPPAVDDLPQETVGDQPFAMGSDDFLGPEKRGAVPARLPFGVAPGFSQLFMQRRRSGQQSFSTLHIQSLFAV